MPLQLMKRQPANGSSAPLKIHLLGAPRLSWAEKILTIPRRQTRALIYRLAVRLEPVSREELIFLFWPDTPTATGRRNLSHLLTHLRRAIPVPELLLTKDDHIALNPHQVWSDSHLFAQLDALSAFYYHTEILYEAIDLYQGPFLGEFSLPTNREFELWATFERQALEQRYLAMLATLAKQAIARGQNDVAINLTQRYLAVDNLAEAMHRQLIELYMITGNRKAALDQYEHCAVILNRELQVKPLSETRSAYEAVLAGEMATQMPPMTRLTWTTLPSLNIPLIGRETALHHLRQRYNRAQMGQGQMVLISGEAGIGKSRLVQDFATTVYGQTLTLVGAGDICTQTLPYQPIIQALRATLATLDEKRLLDRIQPVWLAEATRILPELRDLHPALPALPSVKPDEVRSRLFDALCQIILGLADSVCPLLLCLDNLHWADSATLDWLAYLAHHLRRSHTLILGLYRTEEASPLAKLHHSLTRLDIHSTLNLEGLDAASVRQLLFHLAGTLSNEDVLVDQLQEATDGNPFFILETLRVFQETGLLPKGLFNFQALPLANTVRDMIEARLENLSPIERRVLEASAVLGSNFTFDMVRLIANQGEMETMVALEGLVAQQILAVQENGDCFSYHFRQSFIRQAVVTRLNSHRLQVFNRRVSLSLALA